MKQVQILMYHRVGNFPGRVKAHGALYCHLPRFRAQMKMFKVLGYGVISLDEAAAGLRGDAPLPPRPLVLTFDDAYVDFLENAAPVLKAHGYPATVYAVSSLVGKTSAWVAPEGLEPAPLMNASQLREVQDLGFTIGSHTVTHPRLADADDARIHAEMRDSKRALEDILGQRVEHFCYPYGSHDLRAVEAAAAAGYVTGTTCVRAAATPADDLLTLPRKAVSRGDDVFGVAWKLLTKNLPKHAQIRRT
ncbi:MAG: polysaccharide deacetylase family protein [Zoogloea oleivorans]|jgi:peptidoglycan/xylan/chitin deacetylase (PgdA/CDA1 family)|uniref:polysaccharide deacetylase family protein n=1 Tax=Zoogloea oleivorans TaxID=1552750 RepID=UPI002A369998|nr:polysaccharide deacetylase family protein [Zoogloea oleivorans]MDY0034997.1 polysaccharide deacetylase family protein [Zoogloea oleivorans]